LCCKLEVKCGSKISNDSFKDFLLNELFISKVDISYSGAKQGTLASVGKNRDFIFTEMIALMNTIIPEERMKFVDKLILYFVHCV